MRYSAFISHTIAIATSKDEVVPGEIHVARKLDDHVRHTIAIDIEVNFGGRGLLVIARIGLSRLTAELLDELEPVVRRGVRIGVDGREIDLVAALLLAFEVRDHVRGTRSR